ncbi:MAG: cytochrome c biogenesis protein CcdA [Candidatus Omnitrophota bacterium]
MTQILYNAFSDTSVLAIFIVLCAGFVSSLSSCTIVRIPVVLGIVSGASGSRKRAAFLSFLFSLGLMSSYTIIGIAFGLVANLAGKLILWSRPIFFVSGILLFFTGLLVAGLIKTRFMQKCLAVTNHFKRFGAIGTFLFGALFAFFEMPGCPCCGSVLLVIVSLVAIKGSVLYSLFVFISFAVGQSLPIFLTGCSAGFIKYLAPKVEKYEAGIQFLAGNMLIVLGLFFILIA